MQQLGRILFGLWLLAFACAASPAAADTRAFIVGVSYSDPSAASTLKLDNTINDARLFERAAGEARAKTTLVLDPDLVALDTRFTAFLASLKKKDLAIIYYAGHGVQADGVNYALTNDGRYLVDLSQLIQAARQRADTVVVFLDACRNNPFVGGAAATGRSVAPPPAAAKAKGRSATRALAALDVGAVASARVARGGLAEFASSGAGLKIVFATDPNRVALDSASAGAVNSPFTASLARHVVQKKPLDDVISAVTREVSTATDGQQTPWQQGSLARTVYLGGRADLPTF